MKVPGEPKNFLFHGNELVVVANARGGHNRSALLRYAIENGGFRFVDALPLEGQIIQDARLFDATIVLYTQWSKTRPAPAIPDPTVEVPATPATLRGGRPLYRVQVQPAGAIGYLYLAESDFGAGCPVLFPWTQELTRGEPHKSSAERADCLASSAKTARGLLRGPCVGDPEQDLPIDLDGDGREDRVLLKDGALALLHNTPTGWRPVLLSDSGSVKVRETAAARAGAASYVIDIEGEWETTDDGDEGDPGIDGAINYSVYRVTRGPRTLQVEQVFQATFGVRGEIDKKNLPDTYPSIGHCRYSGAPDESLTITCGARVTRLRFDPEKRLLRPSL